MHSRLFNIGDIVTLKIHPYDVNNSNIIISGDYSMTTPLMVVVEIYKAKQIFNGIPSESIKYSCTWFSTDRYKFVQADIYEEDLKLIIKSAASIDKEVLKRGDKLVLKTSSYELSKRKSSFTYEENQATAGAGRTTTNSFLSFLPPILQLVNIEPHDSKRPTKNKAGEIIRFLHEYDIKFNFYNPIEDRISQQSLPIEALEIVEELKGVILLSLKQIIDKKGFIRIKVGENEMIAQPRNIAYRAGYYYLRGFNYLSNNVEEFDLRHVKFTEIKTPYKAEAPKFDVVHKPVAATAKFISKEMATLINAAIRSFSFIRIKYKNRNDQITHRTLKDFELVKVKEEGNEVTYLVGYCLLRQANRNFRLDRIQKVQKIDLTFKKS